MPQSVWEPVVSAVGAFDDTEDSFTRVGNAQGTRGVAPGRRRCRLFAASFCVRGREFFVNSRTFAG